MPESFLTVNEIAELLKLNEQTVRNWIDAGTLRAVRVGRRVRVRQSELDRFLAAGETAEVEQPNRAPQASDADQMPGLEAIAARDQFIGALAEILRRASTQDPAELADALREVAAAAEALADTLQRSD